MKCFISILMMAAILSGCATNNATRWKCSTRLKQGSHPACVAFSVAHLLASEPNPIEIHYSDAMDMHRVATCGVSVFPSGSQYLQALADAGYIVGFEEITTADALNHVLLTGPVLAGLSIYDGISDWAHYKTAGGLTGYHCMLFNEVDLDSGKVWFQSSWGDSYKGFRGRFWITLDELFSAESNNTFYAITKPEAD